MNSGPIDVRNVETFCGLTLDEIFAKAKEEGFGGGGSDPERPEIHCPGYNGTFYTWMNGTPNKNDLKVGNFINIYDSGMGPFVVSHMTSTEAYLTEAMVYTETNASFTSLQAQCEGGNAWMWNYISYLKEVEAGTTSGKVFVAAYDQMNGGFDFFNSDEMRVAYDEFGDVTTYWTSTKSSYGSNARYVSEDGSLVNGPQSGSHGVRMTVCFDLTQM